MSDSDERTQPIDGFDADDYAAIVQARQQGHNLIDTLDPDDQLKFFIREYRDFTVRLMKTDNPKEEKEIIDYMEVLASRMVDIEDSIDNPPQQSLDQHIDALYNQEPVSKKPETTEDELNAFLDDLYGEDGDLDYSSFS